MSILDKARLIDTEGRSLFSRYFKLTIGDSETGDQYIYESSANPIKMTFSIKITQLEQANSCTLSVWNFGEKALNSLETHECYVLLEAGYVEGVSNKTVDEKDKYYKAIIFSGFVMFASTSKDGGDWKTDIEAYDMAYGDDTIVAINYATDTTWKTVFEDVEHMTSVVIKDSTTGLLGNTKVRKGFAYVGKMSALLTQGCNSCGAKWTMSNGIIIVQNKEMTPVFTDCFKLSAKSGLIGFPKRVKLQNYSETGMVYFGWEVEYLLNPAIKVGDTVYLDCKKASGYFIASMIGMTGDTYGDTWKCTARLLTKNDYYASQYDASKDTNNSAMNSADLPWSRQWINNKIFGG